MPTLIASLIDFLTYSSYLLRYCINDSLKGRQSEPEQDDGTITEGEQEPDSIWAK